MGRSIAGPRGCQVMGRSRGFQVHGAFHGACQVHPISWAVPVASFQVDLAMMLLKTRDGVTRVFGEGRIWEYPFSGAFRDRGYIVRMQVWRYTCPGAFLEL